MKKLFTYFIFLGIGSAALAQENYRDFESIKKVVFAEWNGVMDSTTANSFSNGVNSSLMCGKYIRDTVMYDNFKMFPVNPLVDVTPYADTAASAPTIKMKVRTSAPAGSIIKIQLGSRSFTTFPEGVHSEYMATTTTSNNWEDLTFKFMSKPVNGYTLATSIDKIVVFLRPGVNTSDTMYFDDPTGPELIVLGVHEYQRPKNFQLYQNEPNPSSDFTSIKIQLNSPDNVSLELFDVFGRKINTITNKQMNKGLHVIPVETSSLPEGLYFYTLKANGASQTKRMVIKR